MAHTHTGVLILAWLCCAAPSAHAQSFALPVDVEQGLVFGAAKPRTPYLFGLRVAPSFDIERARFGVVLGPMYRNTEWDLAIGARMSLSVPVSGKQIGVRFAVQGEYLPVQKAGRVSFGVIGDLLGLLRIGLWPAFDFEAMHAELCLSIGGDIMRWAKVVSDDL
ncbi:MAG TPA: hypothetical protein VFN67_20945 [Polyangiales bacterium]|jgi:hypothetical protein|nr:hypothetical protein [Polyangiales bacterium]